MNRESLKLIRLFRETGVQQQRQPNPRSVKARGITEKALEGRIWFSTRWPASQSRDFVGEGRGDLLRMEESLTIIMNRQMKNRPSHNGRANASDETSTVDERPASHEREENSAPIIYLPRSITQRKSAEREDARSIHMPYRTVGSVVSE